MVSPLAHNPKVSRTPRLLPPYCFLTLPLDWRASGEHSSAIPRISFPARRPAMPFFLHQVSYTPEALARLIANPQDRFDAVRGPIDKLGGRVLNSYFAFGQYDAVLITEMPDNVSAAAIALAFAAADTLSGISVMSTASYWPKAKYEFSTLPPSLSIGPRTASKRSCGLAMSRARASGV